MSASRELPGAPDDMVPFSDCCTGDLISGRYRLLELIGEGGTGVVWLAEQQEPVRRRVAIKMIRSGMESSEILLRFQLEHRALGMMDHPNIARLYDAGIADGGRPYIVMEHIRGIPLTEYCDRERLTLQERLLLFLPVCRAIEHAHQKGIVHRDLKPTNVMVCPYDGVPVPKVIDFGLAKLLNQKAGEPSSDSTCQLPAGTLAYMSPEQAGADGAGIDVRADVYSLGVVLYELLTGQTPLGRDELSRLAFQEVLRRIREEEPDLPSACLRGYCGLSPAANYGGTVPALLTQMVAGDLDCIVLKALQKNRDLRYRTALSLACDIDRYLSDEPVEASPPGQWSAVQKFVRRHRQRVYFGMLVLATILLAVSGMAWGWWQTQRATTLEQGIMVDLHRGIENKQRAQQKFQEQRRRVELYRSEVLKNAIAERGTESSAQRERDLLSSDAVDDALRYWAEIEDDTARVQILESWLQDADSAIALERRHRAILHAAVGASAVRRRLALDIFSERQRCHTCAAEIRAVSCLLTLVLQGTDIPAVSEAAKVLSEHAGGISLPLYQVLWRMIPELPAENRRLAMELMLSSCPLEQTDRKIAFPENLLHWPAAQCYTPDQRSETVLDLLLDLNIIRLEPGMRRDAWWYWECVMSDARRQSSLQLTDAQPRQLLVRGGRLLTALVSEFSQEQLLEATRDLRTLLETSMSGMAASDAERPATYHWMQLLVDRLPPEALTDLAHWMRLLLQRHRTEHCVATVTPLLWGVLPRLPPSFSAELQRELATLIEASRDWQQFPRASLMWTLGECAVPLQRDNAEEKLADLLIFTGNSDQALEMLAWAIHRFSAGLSSETAAQLLTKLQRISLLEATAPGKFFFRKPFFLAAPRLYVVQAMTSLASRLDTRSADEVLQTILEQAEARGHAVPQTWPEQELMAALVPHLSDLCRQRLRSVVFSQPAMTMLESSGQSPSDFQADDAVMDLAPVVYRAAKAVTGNVVNFGNAEQPSSYSPFEEILWQLALKCDGDDRAHFLRDLQFLLARPEGFRCAASWCSRAMRVLLPRSDAATVRSTWEFLIRQLRLAVSIPQSVTRRQRYQHHLPERGVQSLLAVVAAELQPDDVWACICQLEDIEHLTGNLDVEGQGMLFFEEAFDILLRRLPANRLRAEISRALEARGSFPVWSMTAGLPSLCSSWIFCSLLNEIGTLHSSLDRRLERMLCVASMADIESPVAAWAAAARLNHYGAARSGQSGVTCEHLASLLTDEEVQTLWQRGEGHLHVYLESLVSRASPGQRDELAGDLSRHLRMSRADYVNNYTRLANCLGPHLSAEQRIRLAVGVAASLRSQRRTIVDLNEDIFGGLLERPEEVFRVLDEVSYSEIATQVLLRRLADLTRGVVSRQTFEDQLMEGYFCLLEKTGPSGLAAELFVSGIRSDGLPQLTSESLSIPAEDWFSPLPRRCPTDRVITPTFDSLWDALRWRDLSAGERQP